MKRQIFSLNISHLAAEIVRRNHKLPRSTPIVLTGPKKILATCAVAVQAGVQVGMTARQAAYLCPEVYTIPFDEGEIRDAAIQMLRALAEFTDYAEVENLPQQTPQGRKPFSQALRTRQSVVLYGDLGSLNDSDALRQIGQILEAVRGELGDEIVLGAGLASTKFTAHAAAATAEPGQIVQVSADGMADLLAQLPTTLLPLDAEMARRLAVLGLHRLGQIAALPPGAMFAQFGKRGMLPYALARGQDPRQVAFFSREKPLQIAVQFETGLGARDMLESALRGAVNRMAARLRQRGLMAQTISLKIKLEGQSTLNRDMALREATSQADQIWASVQRLLGKVKIASPVSGFEIRLEGLIPQSAQQLPLIPDEVTESDSLQAALEALAQRANAPRCWRVVASRPQARRIDQRYRYEVA